ncbi:MAG: hypothetical protein Q9227_006552 [Pyrenula ochraceoflavens]
MESFKIARESFTSYLTAEEKSTLNTSDPTAILDDIKSLEQKHHDRDVTRKMLEKAAPLIRGLEHYGKALDVIANAKPEILSLLWGGIRIVLHFFKAAGSRSTFWEILKSTRKRLKAEFSNASDRLLQIIDSVREDASLAEMEAATESRARYEAQIKFEEHRLLSAWLDPVDTRANYQAAADICEPGTGLWIFEKDQFREWVSQQGHALWVHAKPGAGKTILASTVITMLQRDYVATNNIVAYYFFDYKDTKSQSTRKMFQTLLMEMCQQSPSVMDFLNSVSRKYQESNSSYSNSILRQLLLDSITRAKADRIFFVIDALDECSDRAELMKQVNFLIGANSQLNLFMASREEYDIEFALNQLSQIAISSEDLTADINLGIDHAIEEMVSSGKLKFRQPSLKDDIRDALSAKADGMFQYVRCQLETLRGAPNDKAIRAALDDLPIGLDDTYIRILEQIRWRFPREMPVIRNIFFLLVHSLRPLSANELVEAAFFTTRDEYLDFEAIPIESSILLQYSGGLFKFVDGNGTLGLAHFSVKTFLLSTYIQDSPVREFSAGDLSVLPNLTARCLRYLRLADFSSGQCFTKKQFATRAETYPFLKYAASSWMLHYRNLSDQESGECDYLVLGFLMSHKFTKNVLVWQQVLQQHNYDWYFRFEDSDGQAIARKIDPIHHAAAHDLQRLTHLLLRNGSNINDSGGEHGHPILTAAFSRVSNLKKTSEPRWRYILGLFDSGAQLSKTPLIRKLAKAFALDWIPENRGALSKLLALGVFQKCPEELGTLLGAISRHPSDSGDAATLLLDYGAEPNSDYRYANSGGPAIDRPLQLACESGNFGVAEILLKGGATLNFAQTATGSPLQAAVTGGNRVVVNWLLQKGADPNVIGGTYGTSLQAAAWIGRPDLVKILLHEGANVNVNGGFFGSPLAAAITEGKQEIIDLLLEAGANVNGGVPDVDPLSFRLYPSKQLPCFELERMRFLFRSPINCAIKKGDTPLIRRLIDLGARLNSDSDCCFLDKDEDWFNTDFGRVGSHPLCAAIATQAPEIIDLLLSKGSDPTLGNYCALGQAATPAMFGLFERLLLNAKEPDVVRGCLLAFYSCTDDGFATQLLDYMSRNRVELPTKLRVQLLYHSAATSSAVRLKFLLELGVRPDKRKQKFSEEIDGLVFHYGTSSILCDAIDQRSAAIVDLLISYDIDVNGQEPARETPLSCALSISNMRDKNSSSILLSLLQHGADPNTPSSGFCASGPHCVFPMQKAVYRADFEAVDHLLRHGADLERKCYWHGTPIMQAVRTENVKMIKHLVNKGSDLHALDFYGQTLLQTAHEECLFEAVDILISLDTPSEAWPFIAEMHLQRTTLQLISELVKLQGKGQHQEFCRLERPGSERDSDDLCYNLASLDLDDPCYNLTSQWPLNHIQWIILGRCLLLGGDVENALIALEQSTYHAYPCSICPYHDPACFKSDRAVRHLCKRGNQTAICKDHCLANHLDDLEQLGRLEEHESVEFPRPIFVDVPEGEVMLNSGERLPRETWLESLQGWKATCMTPVS